MKRPTDTINRFGCFSLQSQGENLSEGKSNRLRRRQGVTGNSIGAHALALRDDDDDLQPSWKKACVCLRRIELKPNIVNAVAMALGSVANRGAGCCKLIS